jgi:hypothetical protein
MQHFATFAPDIPLLNVAILQDLKKQQMLEDFAYGIV